MTMKLYTDLEHVMAAEQQKKKIWKLVLTGGPCGGKTTGQARSLHFEIRIGLAWYFR